MNMTTKIKEILVSTLEGRFKKLHDAANFAEDCSNALAFHSEELMQFELTTEQVNAICKLNDSTGSWTDKFSKLAEKIQSVESQYIDHLSKDKTSIVFVIS